MNESIVSFEGRISVKGSRAEMEPHQSIPHISVLSFQRALRWHPEGIESWSLSDWGVALAGEVGELCNVIKKMNRERDGLQQKAVNKELELLGAKDAIQKMDVLVNKLAMEIGDVYLYLDLIARRAELNLEDCVLASFNRVSEREGFPERL